MDKEARVECLLGSCVWNVATKDCEAYGIYQGVPAVKVKERVIEGGVGTKTNKSRQLLVSETC